MSRSGTVVVIVYTTRYRKGGALFPAVAETLAQEKREAGVADEVVCRAVESKRDVLRVFVETRADRKEISEFHFVGHSGMYGPMFGTVAFPEQFSPYEWETMTIPFAPGASAFFHCCRSARWFAPYFARTFGVRAHGSSGTRLSREAARVFSARGGTLDRSRSTRSVAKAGSHTGLARR